MKVMSMNTALRPSSVGSVERPPSGDTNSGRKAKKNNVSFGLSRFTRTADTTTRSAEGTRPGPSVEASTTRGLLSRHVCHAIHSR